MERRFGRDFTGVRVHTDPAAGHRAAAISADAFTHGTDVSFAHGGYRPETTGGRWLIAHELAHVVQQRGGTVGRSAGAATLEAQADRAATAALRGGTVPALSSAPALTQHKVAMRDVGRGEQSGFARVGELVDRLNTISAGLTFAVTDGELTYTVVEGGTLSEFDRQMMSYIDDGAVLPLRFTNRHGLLGDRVNGFHEGVFVDAWQSAYVDIDDLLASSDLGLQTALTHFLRERQQTRNYTRRIGTDTLDSNLPGPDKEFAAAHRSGINAELAVIRDFFGDPTIRFVDALARVYRNDRGDTIRTKVTEGRGAAAQGIQAISIEVVLHDTHRIVSADEYKEILEAERIRDQTAREALNGATEHREGGRSVPGP